MLAKLQERRGALKSESGFTLIELLVVLIIIGVLLAIAIPSYLGFQKKAQQTAAASDVRQAIPDAVAYYSDNNNYTGLNVAALQKGYDERGPGVQHPRGQPRPPYRQGRRNPLLHLRGGRRQLRARRRPRRPGRLERDHGLLRHLDSVIALQ